MKRIGSIFLSFVLLVAILAACSGNKQSSADGKVTIDALFMKQAGYSEKDVREVTKEFEEQNPNIKIKPTFVAYESLEQKIQTSAKSGGYDVIVMDAPWTAKFAKAGFVKDVSDRLSQEAKEDVFQGALDSVSYNDKLYGMPWLNDTKFLFYNEKILKDAGIDSPPETWNELMDQAKIIKEKGLVEYPVAWSWAQAEALICDYIVMSASFDGNLVDEEGQPTVNAENNVEALSFMVDSIEEGLSNPDSTQYLEEDVRGVFSSGKAAFALNWTYMYNMANDEEESSVAGNVGISPVPGTEGQVGTSVNGGMGLAITSGSKNADEAWKYIEYLSSKDVQKSYAKNALPVWKSLYDDPEVVKTNLEVVEASKTQYQNIENRPRVPWYGELSTDLQVAIQKALLGELTPEEALTNVQKKAEEIVSNQ